MKYLKLATFPGRQYDPNRTAKDMTTMVKVKPLPMRKTPSMTSSYKMKHFQM